MAPIEYFYSAHSVFAYIGSAMFLDIAKRNGRTVIHKPYVLRRGVVGAGSTPTRDRPAKHRAYMFGREIERWSEHRGIACLPTAPESHWNDVSHANCMLIAAAADGGEGANALSHAFLADHWVNGADLSDEAVLIKLAGDVGLDGAALLATAGTDAVAEVYEANTVEAIARSVFGSPTYFVDGDMFYGQDHLELVDRACGQAYKGTWPRP